MLYILVVGLLHIYLLKYSGVFILVVLDSFKYLLDSPITITRLHLLSDGMDIDYLKLIKLVAYVSVFYHASIWLSLIKNAPIVGN